MDDDDDDDENFDDEAFFPCFASTKMFKLVLRNVV